MKIYIPEYVPSQNKGEEAIVHGIYQGLRNQGKDVEISIFSYTPEIDKINYGNQFEVVDGITFRPTPGKSMFLRLLETASIWLRHILFLLMWRLFGKASLKFFRGGNWRAYIDADVILVGHDGVLSDLNILFAVFVKGLGKKSAIFGCGFKKFRFKVTERLASPIISKINVVVLREERSYKYLLTIGIPESKIHLKPDPAFLMEPAARNLVEELLQREGIENDERPLVGMIALNGTSYSKYFFENVLDETERYWKHVSFFATITEKIVDTTKGITIFIPHDVHDIAIARDIKTKMGSNAENVLIMENEYSATVLKALIQRLDFLIAERLHAVIGSSTVGTPFIMVTAREDGRAHNIVEKTIGRPDLIFDINEPKIDDFLLKFRDKLTEKDKIGEYLLDRARLIQEECNEASRLLGSIVQT